MIAAIDWTQFTWAERVCEIMDQRGLTHGDLIRLMGKAADEGRIVSPEDPQEPCLVRETAIALGLNLEWAETGKGPIYVENRRP